MKRWHIAVLFVSAMAPPVHAAGVNLAWNDCGASGQVLRPFACNTNSGTHSLVSSFVSFEPLTQLVGVEVVVDIQLLDATVPSWWTMQSVGGCRFGAVSGVVDYTSGPYTCADPWQGLGVATVQAQSGYNNPNQVRLRGAAAVPTSQPITIDNVSEYYAMTFRISNAKTVGSGACDGCAIPGCVVLQSVTLVQPPGVGDYVLALPESNNLVGWQCYAYVGHAGCQVDCYSPTKRSSWGTVKSLYR